MKKANLIIPFQISVSHHFPSGKVDCVRALTKLLKLDRLSIARGREVIKRFRTEVMFQDAMLCAAVRKVNGK